MKFIINKVLVWIIIKILFITIVLQIYAWVWTVIISLIIDFLCITSKPDASIHWKDFHLCKTWLLCSQNGVFVHCICIGKRMKPPRRKINHIKRTFMFNKIYIWRYMYYILATCHFILVFKFSKVLNVYYDLYL